MIIIVYFFYGLAFLIFGATVFFTPKRSDFLDLSPDIKLLGLFGIIHGINEWVALFIYRGLPFNIELLRIITNFTLPLSFLFLFLFSWRVLSKENKFFKAALLTLYSFLFSSWVIILILNNDLLTIGAAARYLFCFPATALTALAIYIKFKKNGGKQLPMAVRISVRALIITFLFYAVLGGLIVPKAGFFPASMINNDNFIRLVGLPVQLFRMLCAVVFALSCYGLVSLFYFDKGKLRLKGGIRFKLTIFICAVMLILSVIGVSIGYSLSYGLLKNLIGSERREIAGRIAYTVVEMLNEEIDDIEGLSNLPLIKRKILEINSRYSAMQPDEVNKFFLEMDQQWASASGDDPLIKEITRSAVASYLAEIVAKHGDITEILVTDKLGGLIAASGKATDFYQADELWWKKAYADGKGNRYIGGLEFDASSKTWGMSVAVPVRDESNQVVGIGKAVVRASTFLAPLEKVIIGKTGRAGLIDEKGGVVFYSGVIPLDKKIYDDADLKKLIESKKKWEIINFHLGQSRDEYLVAYARVNYPIFSDNNIVWLVIVEESVNEVFSPLKALIIHLVIVLTVLISLIIFSGYFFGGIFARPIEQLKQALEKVAAGDFSQTVKFGTHDELEEVAGAFNKMTHDLKDTTTSIDNLNKEISARKEVETKIAKILQLNRSILESAPFGIYVVNNLGGVDYVNSMMLRISDNSLEQFMKINMFELPTYKKHGIDEKIKSVLRGDRFFMGAIEYVSFYSGKKTVRNITGIPYEEKGEKKALVFIEDITEQKKAEETVKRSAEEWQRTFDSIADPIFIEDTDSVILKANKAFLDFIGLPANQVYGKKCFEIVHHSGNSWPNCPFEKTKLDKTTHVEEVLDEKVGVPLLVTTSPVFNTKGEMIGAVHIAKDISEIKKAREELEKKNIELKKMDQLKSDFVSTVSHELRTPLSITKEGISIILEGIIGDLNEKQRKILDTSRENIERLTRIINELLDISKIESGKTELRMEQVNICEIVDHVITFFSPKISAKGLELKLICPQKEIIINADPDKISQVFTNLVDNAIKFTDQGLIEIGIQDQGSQVECSVKDSGTGIKTENIVKVFEKFQQFGRTAGAGEKGTGLGLAIVKGIIELHKGKIRVESKLGEGTKFIFTLPKSL